MTATHDLFLSYRRADGPAVAPLIAELRSRGVQVWQDVDEVEDFASIQQSVETGLAGARALLAWYSLRYNDSRACQWELTAAYSAAQAEGDPRQRILVLNPEPGNGHVHLPELFDQLHLSAQGLAGDDAAVQALADRIADTLRTSVPTMPLGAVQALTPPRWLPTMRTGSPRFVGRLPQLWQLHGQLQAGQAAMITGAGGRPGVALVRGAGGIGKSLLAEEYALRFGAAYPGGVFWLRAHGHPDGGTPITPAQRTNLRDAQVLDMAQGLGLTTHGLTATQVRAALASYFDQQARPFLWVIDDLPSDLGAEALGDWLAPHPLGCSLFTSRTRRFTQVPCLDLPQLEPADARGLLTRHRQLTAAEAATADAICADLGHHALAVDVTAALVERRGLDGTQRALARTDQDVLALAAQFDEALPNGHQRHIAATFLASIDQLDEHARDLLRLASVLAAAPLPRPLLVRCVAAASGLDDDGAQDRTDLATDRLLSSSLADSAGDGAIAVHTLVARTVRFSEASAGSLAAWRGHAVGVLAEEMVQAQDIRRHAQLEPWVVHARELSDAAEDVATARLLGWVARYDFERGAYAFARAGYEREAEIHGRVSGNEHIESLAAKNNLARVLWRQGDLISARRLQELVLDVTRRVLGEESPSALTCMSNLALTLKDQGDLLTARRLEESVLMVRKRVQGEEHPDTLTSMNNLAGTLWSLGDLRGARSLQESALRVRQRVHGDDHPGTLNSMVNLACTLHSQGDLPGARRLEELVLEVQQRGLGEEHPDTLTSMNNLATTLHSQGDLPGARRLQETVLDGRQRVLGEAHPETLASMNNLAGTLWNQGEHDRARRLQTRCVAGSKRTLGPTHPHTQIFEQGLMQIGGPLDPDDIPNPP